MTEVSDCSSGSHRSISPYSQLIVLNHYLQSPFYLPLQSTHHVEPALLLDQGGKCESSDTARSESEISVDDRPMPIHAGKAARVETGPENPQEQGSDHGEQIRVVDGSLFSVVVMS